MRRLFAIGLTAGLGIAIFQLPQVLLVNGRFDSIVDGAISVAVFVIALLLILGRRQSKSQSSALAYAFLVTGILRFMGSAIDTELEVVWLHRVCSFCLAAGLMYEAIAPATETARRIGNYCLGFVFMVTLGLGMTLVLAPEKFPPYAVNGMVTAPIWALSVAASLTFFLCAELFSRRIDEDPEPNRALYLCSLLFAVPTLLYGAFPLWSLAWWAFQALELVTTSYLAFTLASRSLINNRELLEANERLEEQANVIERTMALVSHDMRNPLCAAIMGTQAMLENSEDQNRRASILVRTLRNLNQVDAMIQSLLDVAGLRVGRKIKLEVRYCDLANEIEQIVEANSLATDRLRLKYRGPILGLWSVSEIHRALNNLISNAVKYGHSHSPIEVTVEQVDQWAVISIHNEGPAIPLSEQAKIFNAFQRSSDSIKSATKGWGLGLALVRGIAEAHGGRVVLKSDRESGTTFSLWLPIRAGSSQRSGAEA